jgi:excisionase family DNA binding protein
MDDTELLTISEVATRLKVSKDTVERRIRDGRLKAIKISDRGRRVKVSALNAYIESLNTPSESAEE